MDRRLARFDPSKISHFHYVSFNQNLCPWGRQLAGAGNTDISFRQTFQFTECETDLDPDLTATPPGPFCFTC